MERKITLVETFKTPNAAPILTNQRKLMDALR
jgi:hypothetical protein